MGIMLPAVIALAVLISFGQSPSIGGSAPPLQPSDLSIRLVLGSAQPTASAHDAPPLLAILFQIHIDHDLRYAVLARVNFITTKTSGPRDAGARWCELYG